METLWQIAQRINTDRCLISFDEPMRNHTTFRIGGPADLYLRPRSRIALRDIYMTLKASRVPFILLGGGSNILVGDKGFRGAVIDTSFLSSIATEPSVQNSQETCLVAECGAQISALCEEALVQELSGIENFYGMPGSVGGAIYMNARCYEEDISSRLRTIEYIDISGETRSCDASSLPWAYKHSPFVRGEPLFGSLILGATFLVQPSDYDTISRQMRMRLVDRMQKHHFDFPSAGSMFKNNRAFGKPSGKILHELGLRGFRIGDAAICRGHANIFVNLGNATAKDMRALIAHAQAVALAATGLRLEPEVLFLGEF